MLTGHTLTRGGLSRLLIPFTLSSAVRVLAILYVVIFSGPGPFTITSFSIGVDRDLIKVTYTWKWVVLLYIATGCAWHCDVMYSCVRLSFKCTELYEIYVLLLDMTPVSEWHRLCQLSHWVVHSWRWWSANCQFNSRCSPVPSHQPSQCACGQGHHYCKLEGSTESKHYNCTIRDVT